MPGRNKAGRGASDSGIDGGYVYLVGAGAPRTYHLDVLADLKQRIRDVVEGPDGNIYVATEGATGGTAADGTVLRIEPVN